jgi:hypothetical protein
MNEKHPIDKGHLDYNSSYKQMIEYGYKLYDEKVAKSRCKEYVEFARWLHTRFPSMFPTAPPKFPRLKVNNQPPDEA